MGKKLVQNLMNLFFLALSIVLFISSRTIERGTVLGSGGDLMPKILAVVLLLLSAVLVLKELVKPSYEVDVISHPMDLLLCLTLLAVYVASMPVLGFMISSTIYLFLQILLFSHGKEKRGKDLIFFGAYAIIFSLAIDLLFKNAFSMILPRGIILK